MSIFTPVHGLLEYGLLQDIGTRTYFGSVAVESVKGLRHFAFWSHGFKLDTFFIVHMDCMFGGASCKLIKNLATLNPEKLQGFHWNPLSHCYTRIQAPWGGENIFSVTPNTQIRPREPLRASAAGGASGVQKIMYIYIYIYTCVFIHTVHKYIHTYINR